MDKREIMDYARREGTYEISIVQDQDCCTLFVPKHPTIAARSAEVEAAESQLDVEALVRGVVATREQFTIEPAWASTTQDLADEIS
jgi:thiamine biosynthesis protein ThiI